MDTREILNQPFDWLRMKLKTANVSLPIWRELAGESS